MELGRRVGFFEMLTSNPAANESASLFVNPLVDFQSNAVNIGNRYFWGCMFEHTKRQVYKWKFLEHALSRYVYNRSLFDIFTQVEMAEE